MKFEERAMWICLSGLLAVLTVAAMAGRKPLPPPDLAPVMARLDALEARADAALAVRCVNVKTDRMDLAIFPADNLGVKKVK